jgi:hypothetical protein
MGELKKFQKVWNSAKEKLKTEDIKRIIIRHRQKGTDRVALGSKQGQIKDTTQIWQFAKEKLKTAELNKCILGTD